VRFWDSSAIIPLLLLEASSEHVGAAYAADPAIAAWWATRLECMSAIVRREREGSATATDLRIALERLAALADQWVEVEPVEPVRRTAARVLRTHPLTTTDALQLAAAIVAADGEPRALTFVTLDARLALAAQREGFPVLEPA
jgi:predicted nucleic acid-binding protein